MQRLIIFLNVTVMFLSAAAVCLGDTNVCDTCFRASPDQVLVLYNADWTKDSEGTEQGQDSLELAEYYQKMHTDPVTGKKPFLLPLHCVHGKKHLNDWYIKELSTDNKNAISFKGTGDPPKDYNWVLDSRNVEVIIPDKNTDWDSVAIRVRSESSDLIKTIYLHRESLEGINVKVSGVPKSHGFKRIYPLVKEGEARCYRFDITPVFKGTVNVFFNASDKEGSEIVDLSVRYFDSDDFVFSPVGADGIEDDKHILEDVLQQVGTFLEDPANAIGDGTLLKDHILYIVLAHGLPYSANGIFGAEHGATSRKADHGWLTSLDQRLASMYYPWGTKILPPVTVMYLTSGPYASLGVGSHIITTAMRYPLTGVRWNPYLHPDAYSYLGERKKTPPSFYPVASFQERRQRLTDNFHSFAVTRIDGKDLEDAKHLIDSAIYASRYLRPEMDCLIRKRLNAKGLKFIENLPELMKIAEKNNLWGERELTKIGFRSKGVPFMAMPPGATEGSCQDESKDWQTTGFYPGGMHIKVISSNGLNYKKAEVWKMLERGVTVTAAGSPAYSDGPHITNTTFWDNRIVMRYLLRGKDLGEALMLSNFHINWSTSYLGDPLLHPDLRETVIDKTPPIVSKENVAITLTRIAETFTASFAAGLEHNPEFPEVAAMRIGCKNDNGVELNGHSSLFSRRPTVMIQGLTPENKYRCSVTFADPYENLTTIPAVNFTTPKITMSEKFIQGVGDFFKGIKVVPRR